jgi:hypothetical protein
VAEPSSLIEELDGSAADYLLFDDHSPEQGHCLFRGTFQGQNVIWDCHIHPLLNPARRNQETPPRHFIDIAQQKNYISQRIDIGLNVINITRAVVLKSVIMVRQYKNLDYGRHEWK